MSIGEGFMELAKTAGDYINNGMGKEGSYAAVRAARQREQNRDNEAKTKAKPAAPTAPPASSLETPTNPTADDKGDATPTPRGGMEVA